MLEQGLRAFIGDDRPPSPGAAAAALMVASHHGQLPRVIGEQIVSLATATAVHVQLNE